MITCACSYSLTRAAWLLRVAALVTRSSNSLLHQRVALLFAAASLGDAVAASQVDRQAQEIVIMAVTALRRLELQHSNVPVILGGGVLASNDSRLMSGIASGMEQQAPHARIQLVTVPPILGAGLLALESIGADTEAVSRAERNLREALDQGLGLVYEAGV